MEPPNRPPRRDSVLELTNYSNEDDEDERNYNDEDATDRVPLMTTKEEGNAPNVINHLNTLPPSSWFQRLALELQVQSTIAFPALLSLVMSKIPWFISLRFLGNIGGEELAAAALATTLHNVTGMSLSVGLSFALSTLAGQAKGELMARGKLQKKLSVSTDTTEIASVGSDDDGDDNEGMDALGEMHGETDEQNPSPPPYNDGVPITPIVYLLRGMCIQLCLVIPVGIWWLVGIKDMLVSLGQGPQLASMASSYIQLLTPSLWAYSVQWTLTCFLQTVGMADVPARATLLGLVLHIPFNWMFVYGLNFGYHGCGMATAAFQVVQVIYLCSYILFSPTGQQRLLDATGGTAIGRIHLTFTNELRLAVGSFRGFTQYFGLALPGIVIISEWWASETGIFLSGRLTPNPDEALAGMTIYQSINAFCFMFPMAFGISGTSRVGSLLGEGLEEAASWAGRVCVLGAAVLSCSIGLLLYFIPHDFLPRLFAPNESGVIYEAAQTIPLLSMYVVADGIQVALNGIIKGCGRQCVTVPIVIVSYWVIGVPLAYYLVFMKNDGLSSCEETDGFLCGDVGLVAALTTGTWVHMLLLTVAVFGATDWNLEARKAKERVLGS